MVHNHLRVGVKNNVLIVVQANACGAGPRILVLELQGLAESLFFKDHVQDEDAYKHEYISDVAEISEHEVDQIDRIGQAEVDFGLIEYLDSRIFQIYDEQVAGVLESAFEQEGDEHHSPPLAVSQVNLW